MWVAPVSGLRWVPVALALGPALWAGGGENRGALSYSAAGVVNAASNASGPLAPYAIASLYGTGLAYSRRAVAEKDIRGGLLPTELDGVRVLVEGMAAPLYYVSPEQINFLIPYNAGARFPTQVTLRVTLDGRAGPEIRVPLNEAAPALFQLDATTPVVTTVRKAEGSDEHRVVVISKDEPARPGEIVTLWATGLGRTQPPVAWPQLPREAFRIANWQRFQILLAGTAIPAEHVLYAGVAPNFAGLYQINVRLPEDAGKDPEIRIAVGEAISPEGLRLPVTARGN
jgi:uncharacterized protein (TIGR03437 family)